MAENVQEIVDYVIDEILKTSGCIRETKRHNLVIEVAISRPERDFALLPLCDVQVVVAIAKI